MLLNGIFPPITTPFYPDGNVYFKKIEHNVERYSKTPVAGLVMKDLECLVTTERHQPDENRVVKLFRLHEIDCQ